MTAQPAITGTVVVHEGKEVSIKPGRGTTKPLSETEARALTTEIQQQTIRLWMLVGEAHDRKAWAALGYEDWKQYVTQELQMSESRSYQLLDQARIMSELAKAGVDTKAIEPPPARVVQRVKGDIKGVRRVVKKALREGGIDDQSIILEALRSLAAEHTPARAVAEPLRAVQPLEEEPDELEVKPPRGMRWCPGCEGSGVVTLVRAKVLADFMKKTTTSTGEVISPSFSG